MNDEEVSGSTGMMILVIFGSKKWLVTLVFCRDSRTNHGIYILIKISNVDFEK